MSKAPWVKWSFRDWLSDMKVRRLTLYEQGVYLEILALMWEFSEDQCSIPDDPKYISKSLGISKCRWLVMRTKLQHPGFALFLEENGHLVSKRLRKEHLDWTSFSKRQSLAGIASAQKRLFYTKVVPTETELVLQSCLTHNENTNKNEETDQPRFNHRSTNKNKNKERDLDQEKEKTLKEKENPLVELKKFDPLTYPKNFESFFWKHYPKKVRKKQALLEWKKVIGKAVSDEELELALREQATWPSWINGYIPDPDRWLKHFRWTDEKPPAQTNGKQTRPVKEMLDEARKQYQEDIP